MSKKLDIGGQAVIEGVMMRSKNHILTAVRKKGKIIYKKDKIKKKPKFLQLFFIRGIVNLIEMLVIGIKALNWSTSQQTEEEEEISNLAIVSTLIIAFLFAIALFLLLPYLLTYLIGIKETQNPIWFNMVDGIIKIAIFILYVYIISLIKEIRKVFQYHGAEHKAIFCYENNKKLKIENARRYSTLHPRCGTAFLMIVIIISIFLFSFIPIIIQSIHPNIVNIHWLLKRAILFTTRILLLPIIAGFSYEILKFGAKHQDNPIFKSLILPGVWVQKITTKEPTKKQLEVSLFALKRVLELENK